MSSTQLIRPDWPAPANIRAVSSTRLGGVSTGVYSSLNLGAHVQDSHDAVCENRRLFREAAQMPNDPVWLEQIHGCTAVVANEDARGCDADAAWTRAPEVVCAVMTADCLPVLFCDRSGSAVAAAHAGWRGLVAGVLENTLRAMNCDAADVIAWIGPGIGPAAFEVGSEVREAFVDVDASAEDAFAPSPGGRWLANLPALARKRLLAAGMGDVFVSPDCTYSDAERFFSFRRDGPCGRMASAIWIAGSG